LGIENPSWGTSPQGVTLGGYGLSIRTEDIARFGQLYLQKGKWHGKQLVPAGWIEAATARQTSNGSNPKSDWDQGYFEGMVRSGNIASSYQNKMRSWRSPAVSETCKLC
jgi:CubicO group peptidase (beta-lactamase class C family)